MSVVRKILIAGFGAGALGAFVWAMWPQPIAVDLAQVVTGDLRVTVSAEGITRVREPYLVTAPLTGMVLRSPVEVGDVVVEGQTLIAQIQSADPALMDARSRAQAEAAVAEAEAALALADTNLRRAISGLSHAQDNLTRARALAEAGTISQRALEDASQAFTDASQALAAARSERDLHQATLIRARAQLLGPEDVGSGDQALPIFAPHSGTVLEVSDPSARFVQAGTPLLTIGDLADLEIEVDLLSTDALGVEVGASAMIERWGGDEDLPATVRRIEPAAFTRISALGIEEQRVRLKLDFVGDVARDARLGDRYRVFARIETWHGTDLILVPQSALFRRNSGWAVFVAEGGVAHGVDVVIGQQAEGMAEVREGLVAGDTVILYPSNAVAEGVAIAPRGE